MPGFQRLAQFQFRALIFHLAEEGEAEFKLGDEPLRLQVETVFSQIGENVEEIRPDVVRQHEAVSKCCTPADELSADRVLPETGDQRAHQQLLGKRHAGIRRHFKTAEFHKAKTARRAIGRKQLVDADFRAVGVAGDIDQKIAEQTVDQPRQGRHAFAGRRHLGHGDFQLVHAVVARFIDARRLAGGADEEAGEKVGERGVALPVQHEALQQIGTAQERAVIGVCATDDHMVAAAGAGVATVDHELVGAKARLACVFINRGCDIDALLPACRRMDVNLDDAGIRCDANNVHALVMGRRVALDMDGQAKIGGGSLCGCDEVEIILNAFDRRHKDAEPAIARFDG